MLKTILVSLILMSQICFAQSTYNFYFNDSSSGPSGPSSPMTTPPPVQQQPQPTYINNAPVLPATASSPHAFSIMDTYLNVGMGAESYFRFDKPSFFVKTKFLPLIGFEAAFPNRALENNSSDYRAAAYLEGGFFDFLRIQLLGGVLRLKREETIDPYVGIGASLRLFKAIEISVSANTTIKSKFKFNEDDLLSVGGYKFASGAISVDIFKLFHLL